VMDQVTPWWVGKTKKGGEGKCMGVELGGGPRLSKGDTDKKSGGKFTQRI